MVLIEIGTAGVISAYFFRHMTSGYSLNVSDPIEGKPVQLSYYLCVFGCGLVFWLLVLLWAKLHDSGDRQADIRKVAKLAKLIAPITTLNLCGCLLAPFMKLPLLVRFLVLFQVSSNLALLLLCAFLSLKEYMILLETHTPQKSSPKPPVVYGCWEFLPKPRGLIKGRIVMDLIESVSNLKSSCFGSAEKGSVPRYKATRVAVHNIDGVGGKVDEAGGSGSGHGSGASGSEENRGRYGGNDGGGGAGGGGDRGASRSGHGSGASGSGGGNEGGDIGRDGGGDRGASGSRHGSGASGSGRGSEGGDRGRDGGSEAGTAAETEAGTAGARAETEAGTRAEIEAGTAGAVRGRDEGRDEDGDRGRKEGVGDPESGGRETSTEQAFKSSKITEMSLMLTAQTTATLVGFNTTPTPSSSTKALLVVALMDQLVAYLCGLTSILLSANKPGDSKAAKIFAEIGFVCTALGFILMVAMYVPWYFVLIAVLLFGVVWLIFFWNGLKTRATEVWNYLKNSTQSIKSFGVVWLIFFRNGLKTRATEVWNYLKNSTQSIKNCIEMLFESGS